MAFLPLPLPLVFAAPLFFFAVEEEEEDGFDSNPGGGPLGLTAAGFGLVPQELVFFLGSI